MKLLVRGLVVVVVLVAGLVGLAFVPGVQRHLFLKAVAQDGRTVAVDRLSAGLGGVSMENLRWNEAGNDVAIEKLSLRLPVTRLLGSNRSVEIEELIITGLRADIAATKPAPTQAPAPMPEAAPASTDASSSPLALPFPVSVRRISVAAELTLPDAGSGRPVARLTIEGGDFAAGAEGSLRLKGSWTDPAHAALAAGLALEGTVRVRQSATHAIEHAALTLATPLVQGEVRLETTNGALDSARLIGDLTADLARLVVFVPQAARPPLAKGTLKQTFEMKCGGDSNLLSGTTTLTDLANADGSAVLAGVTIRWSARQPTSGASTVEADVSIVAVKDQPASDIVLKGTIDTSTPATRVDLDLTSRRLAVPALLTLTDIATQPSDPAVADRAPIWEGLLGTVRFVIAEVLLPGDTRVADARGTLKLDTATLAIAPLTGNAYESPFRRHGQPRLRCGSRRLHA